MTDAMWDRIWSKVDARGDCWEWTGARARGYARFTYKDGPHTRGVSVHRAIWERLVGPIPADLQVDHLCRVRHCVNPDHLELVTARENLLRSYATKAGRNARRTHCPQGHPYDDRNTGRTGGNRRCLACHREKEYEPNKRRRLARQESA